MSLTKPPSLAMASSHTPAAGKANVSSEFRLPRTARAKKPAIVPERASKLRLSTASVDPVGAGVDADRPVIMDGEGLPAPVDDRANRPQSCKLER